MLIEYDIAWKNQTIKEIYDIDINIENFNGYTFSGEGCIYAKEDVLIHNYNRLIQCSRMYTNDEIEHSYIEIDISKDSYPLEYNHFLKELESSDIMNTVVKIIGGMINLL